VKRIEAFLQNSGVGKDTVLVATSSQDSPGEIFLGPYTAMAIAEYFRDMGRDVLVIFDDLTMHAMFYRELSLISQKFPGTKNDRCRMYVGSRHEGALRHAFGYRKTMASCI